MPPEFYGRLVCRFQQFLRPKNGRGGYINFRQYIPVERLVIFASLFSLGGGWNSTIWILHSNLIRRDIMVIC